MSKTARKTFAREDTEAKTWFERDRAHVDLQDRETGRTLIEFWDEDVEQLLEDGFLDRRDLHGSLYKYAVHLGVIKAPSSAPRSRSHATKRTRPPLHSTKKTPAQLDREVSEALAPRSSIGGTRSLVDAISPGSRVTIVDRFGKQRTGRAVIRGPYGWVLNMGGKHGTPAIASDANTVSVRYGK